MSEYADSSSVARDGPKMFQPVRLTQSARTLNQSNRGADALLLSFSPLVQNSIRQLLAERAEFIAEHRALQGNLRGGRSTSPLILKQKQQQLAENLARLQRLAGREAAAVFIEALRLLDAASGGDEAVALTGESDAAAAASRRHMAAARSAVSSVRSQPHDLPTAKGDRDVHNSRPADHTSYYQSQQQKYGRGRRGSTSIAG